MKLSAFTAAILLTTLASAQGWGGGASDAGEGADEAAIISFFHGVNNATIAHGVLMCLAFVILFPAGSFLLRLAHFKGLVYVHAGIQMFAYMMALAGMGLGVYAANSPTRIGAPSQISGYHPVIGLFVLSALLFQPILGLLHHAVYVREQRRSIWSTLHVWWGRAVLTLAIIEGGLGFKLAQNTTAGEIVYGLVAGLIWISWLGVAVWHDTKKSKGYEVREERSDSEAMTPTKEEEAGLN